MTKRNYVRSSRYFEKNPRESKFASISKLQTFRAALRDHVKENWPQYTFAKAKGFTPETYADMFIRQIEQGQLRTMTTNDPTLKGACKQLMIPHTFKAIERYLGD